MRFLPHTSGDVARMLEAAGLRSVEELFAQVPASLQEQAGLTLPDGVGEQDSAADG